jgi:PIN domain nuclease of toxin-antitoxin system
VKLLLDTHAVLWLLAGDSRIPEWLREVAAETGEELLVSDVSLWEIAIKSSLGRVQESGSVPEVIDHADVGSLAITRGHVWRVRDLELHHRDPFDRLLVAQSLMEDLTIGTSDTQLARYGVATRW